MPKPRTAQVGDIFTLASEYYGLVAYITVAKVNLLHPKDKDAFLDTYVHPKHLFSSFSISSNPDCFINPENPESQFAYFVSVPLEIANLDWWAKNPDCAYRQKIKRKPRHTTPPSCVTLKDYEKWLKTSLPGLESHLSGDDVKTIAATLTKLSFYELQDLCINPTP